MPRNMTLGLLRNIGIGGGHGAKVPHAYAQKQVRTSATKSSRLAFSEDRPKLPTEFLSPRFPWDYCQHLL